MLLDGVPISDIDELLEIPASELDKIDIFYTRYIVSDIIMEGIIHFVTKNGDMSSMTYNKDVFRQAYYSVDDIEKYFDFPVYNTEEEYNNHIPDYRNTLYWNPNVKVDANGTSSISFYTSDEKGLYSVIVEGFSKNGEYLRETQTFSVIE